MTAVPLRAAAAALAALAALVTLPGCRGPEREQRRVVVRDLHALDAAIRAVNDGRAALLADVVRVTAAVSALDEADAYGVAGDHRGLRARRAGVRAAMTAALPALRRLDAGAAAYRDALGRLATAGAGPEVPAEVAAAVEGVVAAGRTEADRTASLGRVGLGVWTRFQALDETQETWTQRASNGWYRSTAEAASAYAVMSRREELAGARRALERADAARAQAATATEQALRQARDALGPLLGTPTPDRP